MEQAGTQARPVPAPRRLCPEVRPNNYENIQINNINNNTSSRSSSNNKKLNIAVENLQNSSAEKPLPSCQGKLILQQPHDVSPQPIYGPDANENVPMAAPAEPLYATPKPAPRQRANPEQPAQAGEPDVAVASVAVDEPDEGAAVLRKAVRAAPQVPPKPLNSELTERRRRERYSITSEFSTTSARQTCEDSQSLDASDQSRYASTGSLNNSDSSQSRKFKSPSPGYVELGAQPGEGEGDATSTSTEATEAGAEDASTASDDDHSDEPTDNNLLRSLGSTSKLLGEAIGERMAFKARGAKKRLDKNLRSSSHALSNLSSDAGQRLKLIGNNFKLGRRDNLATTATTTEAGTGTAAEQIAGKATGGAAIATPSAMDFERRQTVHNTEIFNSIQFSSPLHRNAMGGGRTDLSTASAAASVSSMSLTTLDDGSYEVPRQAQPSNRCASPPSYDEALRDSPAPRSKQPSQHLAAQTAKLAQQRSQPAQSEHMRTSASSETQSERGSLNLPSPPMPTFPPPALPMEALQPPARHRRRKNYEHIQLRRAPSPQGSLRVNVDSAELRQLNLAAAQAEREGSQLIREQIAAQESRMPKPERSDSWEFQGDELDESQLQAANESTSSTPEPVYANHEATYGKVFEMATVGSNVLQPHNELSCIQEEGAVGGQWLAPTSKELIQEFDPLMDKTSTLTRSSKSNELLLLEHLLEEDTYGTVRALEHDDVSMCTSEEDAVAGGAITPTTPTSTTPTSTTPTNSTGRSGKGEAQQKPATTLQLSASEQNGSKLQIVHQNAQLLSDSMENMVDDGRPAISQQRPAAAGTRARTNWFVGNNGSGSANSNGKLNIEGDSPPTYLEAIGGDGKPIGGPDTKPVSLNPLASSSSSSTLSSRFRQTMNAFTNVKIRVDAMKRRASFKAAQRQSDVKVALQMVPRPSLSPLLVRYEGPLIRFPSGVVEDILKEMQNRKAVLRDRQFQTFLDQEMKTPKECIPLDAITTLQCVSNSRVTDNSTHFYCFELTTSVPKNGSNGSSGGASSASGCGSSSNLPGLSSGNHPVSLSNPNLIMTSSSSGNCKQQRVAHLYGVGKESERGVWMQKLLESLTNSIPVKYTCHYYRAGWCYLKTSITGEWSGTWLVLRKSQRRLIFVSDASGNVEKMDLRKARCIVLKESDESIDNLHVEAGPMLMIDCPPYAVYMIMSSARETKIWRHIIREVAHNNGFLLSDQQLTRYDVPVIVDKCINFVYIHGSMSEGIYRKSGSENSMHKLMSAFRADAFNVEITRNEYNEHDVANVLKRFMRDLPERLLGKQTESFMFVTELTEPSDKIPIYKDLLARLSIIERETLRRIVGHLVFISSQQAKNKMSIQNLTMIWGPTLLAKKSEEMVYSQKEADVLSDLIVLYKNLFPCSADEIKKEQAMLSCLQKYYAAAETLKDAVKKSGDIKIWISLNPNPENTTEEKTQVNATISPTKTAYELCREYANKMKLPTHQLTLYEVILNDSLERPLHHDTKVFDVILNWSYWPEEDRKHNYLVVRPIEMLREVQRAVKNLATVTPGKELRFADNRTKTFKTLQCELRDGKIVISKKDKNDKSSIVREIFLHSSTAYLGCERKRDFPWSWAITFVERTQSQIMRSRDAPFIGHVLAGSEWVDRTIWFSSIWYCLYGENILPPAEIIIK